MSNDSNYTTISECGMGVLEELLGESYIRIFQLARSGYHDANPYHNLEHELQHVYWSHACAVNDPGMVSVERLLVEQLPNLAVASLFHDHNHSGGKLSDKENIAQAVKIVPMVIEMNDNLISPSLSGRTIARLIECTQYNGKDGFEREPMDLAEKCMRDADLMSIYSDEGRDLLIGLYTELGMPLDQMKTSELQVALEKNAEFLRNATMYTNYGQKMKEYHLENALKYFAQQVRGTL
jgi:transcription termination factor NusB